jgi:hypothetical protein
MSCLVELELGTLSSLCGMGHHQVPQWSTVLNSGKLSLLTISHNFVGYSDNGNFLLPGGIFTSTEHLGQNRFLPLHE